MNIKNNDIWEVKTHDKTYKLTGKQAQILKDATSQKLGDIVWFDGFAIATSHIISVKKIN
jgi:hypothetical protein